MGVKAVVLALLLVACDEDRTRGIVDVPTGNGTAPTETRPTCTEPIAACVGTGPCGTPLVATCSDGFWWCAEGGAAPGPETCNGLDDDCDGATDEGLFDSCYTGDPTSIGVGACAAGVRRCGSATCFFETIPSVEVCDGLDNDCNGRVDDGVSVTPGCCSGEATTELCDGLDNNCDGVIDEGLTYECAGGTYCLGGGPDEIPCDGMDNDCDGATDEDDAVPFEVAFAVDVSGSNADGMAREKAALQALVGDLAALESCARFDVGVFGSDPHPALEVLASDVDSTGAIAALSRIGGIPGWLEPSYDVAIAFALPFDPGAIRSIVMIADEPGQSLNSVKEADVAATFALHGVQMLTVTKSPESYDSLGPTAEWSVDIPAVALSFLRVRAGL